MSCFECERGQIVARHVVGMDVLAGLDVPTCDSDRGAVLEDALTFGDRPKREFVANIDARPEYDFPAGDFAFGTRGQLAGRNRDVVAGCQQQYSRAVCFLEES